MKNPHLIKQKDRNPTAGTLFNLRPQFNEQALNIAPLDIAACWPRKNQLNSSLMPALHSCMVPFSGTKRDHCFLAACGRGAWRGISYAHALGRGLAQRQNRQAKLQGQQLGAFRRNARAQPTAGRARHPAVVQWIQDTADAGLHISAVTIGEIQAGIEQTREQDEDKASQLSQWLAQVAETFNVVPMDAQTFREWVLLMRRASDTLCEDAMIAATARVRRLTVVTRRCHGRGLACGYAPRQPWARISDENTPDPAKY